MDYVQLVIANDGAFIGVIIITISILILNKRIWLS